MISVQRDWPPFEVSVVLFRFRLLVFCDCHNSNFWHECFINVSFVDVYLHTITIITQIARLIESPFVRMVRENK